MQLTYTTASTNQSGDNKVFQNTITAVTPHVDTDQNLTLSRHIPISEAYANLSDYDVLVIPGGGSLGVLNGKTEPLGLIAAFAGLKKREDGRTRYILSVCTGSLFLGEAGVLHGLSATTHEWYYERLRAVCASKRNTKVLEERFVVNKTDEKGLRIVTSGGVSCGLDSALWLIDQVAGKESMEKSKVRIQYASREGVVL